MKKKSIYTLLVVVFAAAIGIIIFSYSNKKTTEEKVTYTLLKRAHTSEQDPQWALTQKNAADYLASINEDPADVAALNKLATLYIQEARITGNYAYYDKAAMKYVDDALAVQPNNFESLTLKSLLYISQHHFAEGLAAAQQAQKINPYNAFVYGILVDGNVEMGNYQEAVSDAQKMIDIRPDLRSYSRVSYLREIHGDYPGAIDIMESAIESGIPGDEATEWARIQLGHLLENTGEIDKAEMQYKIALMERPNYPFALAGLSRIATYRNDLKSAIDLATQASALINDFGIRENLAAVYRQAGDTQKANEILNSIIKEMTEEAQSGVEDESIGHYVDMELAYAYVQANEMNKAFDHATQEYNRRPENIDVNNCMAWVLYKKGEYAKALPYVQTALKTNSKNPVLLTRAGLIFAKNNKPAEAKNFLSQAVNGKANLPSELRTEASTVLKTL